MRKVIKIGEYEIHSYPALIKITYDDGSISYDNSYGFTSSDDFLESWYAIKRLMDKGDVMAFKPVKIIGMEKIYGVEAVSKVLRQIEAEKSGIS